MLKDIQHTFHHVCRIPRYLLTQTTAIANDLLISFWVIILVVSGYSEHDVTGLLAAALIASGVCLSLLRQTDEKRRAGSVKYLLGAAAAGLLVFAVNRDLVWWMALAACCTMISRDMLFVQMHNGIREQSDAHGTDTRQILAGAIGCGILLSAAALFAMGAVASYSTQAAVAVIGMLCGAAAIGLSDDSQGRRRLDEKQTAGNVAIAIPLKIYIQCAMSFLYTAISYFSRRIALPLILIEAGQRLGFSESIFYLLGLAAGLITIAALVTQRGSVSGRHRARPTMFRHYFVGITLWLTMIFGLQAIAVLPESALFWVVGGLIGVVMAADVSARIWTIGFLEELRVNAQDQAIVHSQDVAATHKAYLGVLMWNKNLGAGCGLLMAYLFYDTGVTMIMSGVAVFAAGYGLMAIKALEKPDGEAAKERCELNGAAQA